MTSRRLRWLKKKLPNKSILKRYRLLKLFGGILHRPGLWKFSRSTLAKGAAIGLFAAFVPLPFQMVMAAALAVFFSANLPLSVSLVWVTNPLTIPPLYYFCYKIGAVFFATKLPPYEGTTKMASYLYIIWKPFLLGSFICGTIAAVLGYIVVYILVSLFLKRRLPI